MKSVPSPFLRALARLCMLLTLGASVFCFQPGARGQAQPGEGIVRAIQIQFVGPESVTRERILANMRTQIGSPYSVQVAESDIKNLYATGNISNLRIFTEPVKDGVKVVVVVQARATVKAISFQGVKKVKEGRLRDELTLKPGESLNEATLEQDRQKLVDYYVKKGFSDVDVQYKVQTDEEKGTARVLFAVNEGGKQIIRKVSFVGNVNVPSKQLQKAIKTKAKGILAPFLSSGKLNREQLSQDTAALEDLYRDKGYADARVSDVRVEPSGGGRVDVVFQITEGEQYKVGKLSIGGQQLFAEAELRALLRMTEGKTYGPAGLRKDMKSITDLYGSRGYVDLQLIPETTPGGKGVVNIAYKIDEGTQSYVQRINIEGNTRTKDKVVRRELALAPGDIYNTVLVDASRQRLQNLNYFSKVEAFPGDSDAPGRKDLNVRVEEKRTGSFNFGAGFSSIDSFIGFAELQQTNFDLFKWPSFTGGGQKFRARLQYGDKRKDFVIGVTEPWFFDHKLAVGGELFWREATYISDYYDQRNYGASLNARKPIGEFTAIRFDYRLENVSIYGVTSNASPQIKSQEGDYLKSSLSASLQYDTRDSVFLTRHGHRLDLTAFTAGGPLGGDVDTYGLTAYGAKYFLLPWDTILQVVGEVAVVDTGSGGKEVPIFDRLFLGGANTLRGFDYRDVGPKDYNGEPLGGGSMARMTVEWTFPVIERVRGALFYDAGFVNTDAYDWSTSGANSDVGIGVRLDLPIGPVRLDFGIPIQSDSFNDSGGKFNFNVGYQF